MTHTKASKANVFLAVIISVASAGKGTAAERLTVQDMVGTQSGMGRLGTH